MSIQPYFASFSPRNIAGCTLWLDGTDPAGTGVIPSAGTLQTWVDKSGSGNNATQSTGGNRPTYSNNGVVFSGSQWYQTSITSYPTAESIFIVFRTTTGIADIFAGTTGSSREVLLYTGNKIFLGAYGNDPSSTTPNSGVISLNTNILYSTQYTSSAITFNVNGTTTGSGSPPFTFSGTGTSWIGSSGYAPNNMNGTIYEFIYYNGSLSSTLRQQIESYLAQKWGLTASLPGGHLHATQPAGALTKVANAISMIIPATLAKTVGVAVMSYLPMLTNSADIGGTPQTVTTNGTVTYTTIAGKQCAYFSNSLSNYLSFSYTVQTQLTLCFWLYCIDAGYYTAVSINNGALNPTLQVDINTSTNNTTIYTAMPNQWAITPGGNYGGPSQWAHFAITLNYSTYFEQVYINGNSVATATGSGSPSITQSQIWLGRSGDNGRAYYGYLRQFCFFPTVLTQAQIRAVQKYTT
jgi:hypothetical protein